MAEVILDHLRNDLNLYFVYVFVHVFDANFQQPKNRKRKRMKESYFSLTKQKFNYSYLRNVYVKTLTYFSSIKTYFVFLQPINFKVKKKEKNSGKISYFIERR